MIRLALTLLPLLAGASRAVDNPAAAIDRAEASATDRIQTGVLNPILGAGKSAAFVRLTLVVKSDEDYSGRGGEGKTTRTSLSGRVEASTGALSGIDLDPSTAAKTGEDERTQESSQTVGKATDRASISRLYTNMRIVVLHDENVPAKKLDDVRSALLAIYSPAVMNGEIRFVAASFSR